MVIDSCGARESVSVLAPEPTLVAVEMPPRTDCTSGMKPTTPPPTFRM
jgi:hypothetical protein